MKRGRHMSPQAFDEYLASGVAAAVRIEGSPPAELVVDVPNDTLRLEVGWDGEEPPVMGNYLHLTTRVHHRHDRNWATLAVHGRRFFPDAYPLLCSVADKVQVEGLSFTEAVDRSLAEYHEMLEATAPMSERTETGLFGELLVLAHLMHTMGAETALKSWRGGDQSEEHDFGLLNDDVEVKTTTAEVRRHWIGSLTQLRPSPGRRLWLLSVQLTGAGAADAMRLPDLVDLVVGLLDSDGARTFSARVAAAGFRPGQRPRNVYRLLRLRSEPACYLVDSEFPRIGPDTLTSAGAATDRIEQVSYTIRLDGHRLSSDPPPALAGFGRNP